MLPRTMGHRAAVKNVRAVVAVAIEQQIPYLTLFAFGRDNWLRPAEEVSTLMHLFNEVLADEIEDLHRQGVQLRVIGERSRLSRPLVQTIEQGEQRTAANHNLYLRVAIDYSGTWDITRAARHLAAQAASGKLAPEDIDESGFARLLTGNDEPYPDLLIRTSGERRLSNFLIWQLAYAELYFTERLWPEFSKDDFREAVQFFCQRERRFGQISEQLTRQV